MFLNGKEVYSPFGFSPDLNAYFKCDIQSVRYGCCQCLAASGSGTESLKKKPGYLLTENNTRDCLSCH